MCYIVEELIDLVFTSVVDQECDWSREGYCVCCRNEYRREDDQEGRYHRSVLLGGMSLDIRSCIRERHVHFGE